LPQVYRLQLTSRQLIPGQILMATKYLHWKFLGKTKSQNWVGVLEDIIRKLLLNTTTWVPRTGKPREPEGGQQTSR